MTVKVIFNSITYLLLLFCWIKFFLLKSVSALGKMYRIKKYGIHVKGRINNVVESKSLDGLAMYQPVIEFRSLENQIREFIPPNATSIKPTLGSEVDLKYLKDNPDEVILDVKRKLIFEILLFLFSLGILILFTYNYLTYILKL